MKRIRLLNILYILFPLVILPTAYASISNSTITLRRNWQYKWGDSPVLNNGKLLWLEETNNDSSWKSVDKLSDIPIIALHRNLWIRLRIDSSMKNYSAIIIDRIEKIFEVYLDTTKLYSFGQFTSGSKIPFPGFAWHLIKLPLNSSGKTLFFRIRSDTKYIGFYSDIKFGSEEYFLVKIIKTSLSKIILGLVFIFAGFALFIFLLFTRRIKPFPGVIIFMITNGTWTLANTHLTQVLFYSPKLMYYADHLALFASAIGFFMIVVEIIEPAYKKLFTRVYQFFAGYFLIVALLDITGLSDNLDSVAPFLIVTVIMVFVLMYFIFRSARKGNVESKIFLAALAIYTLFALLDIINYFQNVLFSSDTFEMRFAHYGGFAFLIFIAWIFVYRYNEMNKQMLLTQLNERTRIAQDLHDEVGPRITEIKMICEDVKTRTNYSGPHEIILNEIIEAANKVVSSVSEIVWVLNPTNDTLEEFCSHLSQSAIDFLHKAEIRCRINMPPVFPDIKISYEVRRNILMAVKESLNNIVKHADASLASIQLSILGQNLFIVITDDGRGFVINNTRKYGSGLKNIRKRINSINGFCTIETKINFGTKIKIEVPLEQVRFFNSKV